MFCAVRFNLISEVKFLPKPSLRMQRCLVSSSCDRYKGGGRNSPLKDYGSRRNAAYVKKKMHIMTALNNFKPFVSTKDSNNDCTQVRFGAPNNSAAHCPLRRLDRRSS